MIGIESVLFRARVPKGYSDVVLNNVLHVSYLGASLISMETLQQDKNQLQDYGSRVTIIRDNINRNY